MREKNVKYVLHIMFQQQFNIPISFIFPQLIHDN